MDSAYEIRDISLAQAHTKSEVEAFLLKAGLTLDPGLENLVGIYDMEDVLKGCGGLDDGTIKCLALSEAVRGEGIAATLVTDLVNRAFARGVTNIRVFTKPEYEILFTTLGFTLIGRTPLAVLLESDTAVLARYKSYLATLKCDGVIVANANPCTLGHLYLIEQASRQANRLAVIPVADHTSNMFTYSERTAMLRAATAHLDNVIIAEGSDYAVSAATFPSYFIKEPSKVAETQAELDLNIFCTHLAPALGVKVRFVGTEPTDKLTALYNKVMQRTLETAGIKVQMLERAESESKPISATSVRLCLERGDLKEALSLVPSTNLPYILSKTALRALRMELALEPKPGLVDPHDSGSHHDMDFALMSKGIDALQSYFAEIASDAMADNLSAEQLRARGLEGERSMFAATGGVNTHRGAIFALGLAVAAVAHILSGHSKLSVSEEIARLAESLDYATGTHGEQVRKRSGMPGAMDCARAGYPLLFSSWLIYLSANASDAFVLHKLLLKIISEIQDSNAYYRAGGEKARYAAEKAAEVLKDFSIDKLHALNEEYKSLNISHGGAADMLSLTIFMQSTLPAVQNMHS